MTARLQPMSGVSIGHRTLTQAQTGCTVILFDSAMTTAVDVRGAAPGTRELDLLAPGRTVQAADAILLTGGSAFGLRAADGVVEALVARKRGFSTPTGPVPIVPAAVIYDLPIGQPVAPIVADGRLAVEAAVGLDAVEGGAVGAGTGATWGKISGLASPGGIGIAQEAVAGGIVTCLIVLNAFGSIGSDHRRRVLEHGLTGFGPGQATSLMAVITSVPCDHGTLTRLCVAAHDALARLVLPAHTVLDGDVAFASTTAVGTADIGVSLQLSIATELAMERAIRQAAGIDDKG